MVQTKKPEVRAAIVTAARELFRDHGYAASTMSAIAREARTSPANIYVYFDSKLDILFAVYEPWLKSRILRLGESARAIPDPEARLKHVLRAIWHDIPADDNCFANNLIQALAGVAPGETYSRDLLRWAEQQISDLVAEALPPERRALTRGGGLAHLIFMAYDGFAVNHNLNGPSRRIDEIIDLTAALLLGRMPPH